MLIFRPRLGILASISSCGLSEQALDISQRRKYHRKKKKKEGRKGEKENEKEKERDMLNGSHPPFAAVSSSLGNSHRVGLDGTLVFSQYYIASPGCSMFASEPTLSREQ